MRFGLCCVGVFEVRWEVLCTLLSTLRLQPHASMTASWPQLQSHHRGQVHLLVKWLLIPQWSTRLT